MASIDGGTLAWQKELKCQINSVRAPDTQEFLYLAPWEADKDRLCVSEQALTKHWGFFFNSSSHNFCLFFLLLLLWFKWQSGSMSVDVTPPAQHLSRTRPTSLGKHTENTDAPMKALTQTHTDRPQSNHSISILLLVWVHSGEFFCFLTRMYVLALLSYDMLVVNRSREACTHRGKT